MVFFNKPLIFVKKKKKPCFYPGFKKKEKKNLLLSNLVARFACGPLPQLVHQEYKIQFFCSPNIGQKLKGYVYINIYIRDGDI